MSILHSTADRPRPLRRPPPRRRGGAPLAPPLTAVAAVALIVLLSAGYLLWPRWSAPVVGPDAPALPITVAGVAFNVPPAAIRVKVQRRPGAHERVDLAFQWPSLAPPDPTAKPAPPAGGTAPAPAIERIFVTIAAAGDTLEPAERVLNIYPRYTAAQTEPGPNGLTVLPFRDRTPYQGEDLVYDESAPGFLVRCTRGAGPTPGTCLYELRIDAVNVVLRFPRDWLTDWRAVADNIERLLTRLRPPR